MRYEFLTGDAAIAASRFVADRIEGCGRGWTHCVTLAIIDGDIIGGVVFHDYNPEAQTICLSAAGTGRWLTRNTIKKTHQYIFDHCQMAIWECDESNGAINKVAAGLGYTPHRIPRLGGRNKGRIIWTLTDDQWATSKFKR